MIRDGDDPERSIPGHRDAVDKVVQLLASVRCFILRRRRSASIDIPIPLAATPINNRAVFSISSDQRVHGSRSSFGQYESCH